MTKEALQSQHYDVFLSQYTWYIHRDGAKTLVELGNSSIDGYV